MKMGTPKWWSRVRGRRIYSDEYAKARHAKYIEQKDAPFQSDDGLYAGAVILSLDTDADDVDDVGF